MKSKIVLGSVVALLALGSVQLAHAEVILLTHGNSSANIDTSLGQTDWYVDGTNQLSEQSFWYRVGACGGEQALGSLPYTKTLLGTDKLDLTYTGSGFHALVEYNLTGGSMGSDASDLAETISVYNDSGSTLSFTFFQFANFDLAGTPGGDTAAFLYGSFVRQQDTDFTTSETWSTSIGVTPLREANNASVLKGYMTDGNPTTLTDSPLYWGPGDCGWLVQWTVNIAADGVFQISKDKQIARVVPIPDASLLGVIGLGVVGVLRRR